MSQKRVALFVTIATTPVRCQNELPKKRIKKKPAGEAGGMRMMKAAAYGAAVWGGTVSGTVSGTYSSCGL